MARNPLVWLSETLLTITAIPILVMMIHVTLDVSLKYLINFPIQGTLEINAYYYMVSIVVLPMAFVELTRQSIAVDLFYQMMPRGMQIWVTGLVLLICALGYGGLATIAWPDAIEAYEKREIVMGTVNIYIWPSRFLLPIMLFITALVCVMHIWRLATNAELREQLIAVDLPDPDTEAN